MYDISVQSVAQLSGVKSDKCAMLPIVIDTLWSAKVNIADMFGAGQAPAATPLPPQAPTSLGSMLERLLLAQMPMASSWAIRPETFPKGLSPDIHPNGVEWAMEPVGSFPTPGMGIRSVDGSTLLRNGANTNRMSVVR